MQQPTDQAVQRSVAEALPVLVMMADPDGTVTYFNERWHRFTGQPPFERDGDRGWMQYLHPEDGDRVAAAWGESVAARRDVVEMTYRLREAASGEFRWFHARAQALRDGNGEIVQWLGVAMDIDEERRRQATLASLYDGAQTTATILQRASLPAELPQLDGLHVAAMYAPSVSSMTIGGDWYDAFVAPDGSIAVSVGDVRGHGVEAAMLMGKIRYSLRVVALRAFALRAWTPSSILRSVEEGLASEHPAASATAFFGVIAPDRRSMRYANAGHPPPLAVRRGEPEWLPYGDPPLGWRFGVPRRNSVADLAEVSRLVLYTDGLIEAERDILVGMDRLREAVAAEAARTGEAFLHAVVARTGAVPSSDDVAALAVDFAGA